MLKGVIYENARKIPIYVLIKLWKLVGLLKTKKEQEQTNKNKAQYVSLLSMLPIPPDIINILGPSIKRS